MLETYWAAPQIALLLWGYAVATGPIAFLASKERDNPHTQLNSTVFGLTCAAAIIVTVFSYDPSISLIYVFGVGGALSAVFSVLAVHAYLRPA
jgi:hypothetical protein